MTEPVNKVCASCRQACKQAAFVKVIGCPAYERLDGGVKTKPKRPPNRASKAPRT